MCWGMAHGSHPYHFHVLEWHINFQLLGMILSVAKQIAVIIMEIESPNLCGLASNEVLKRGQFGQPGRLDQLTS